jgi:ABC-type transporter Mla subunit MlaD
LILEAVSLERERAMADVASMVARERAELLDGVESQRLATLEWATLERRDTIEQVRRELAAAINIARAERATVVEEVRGIVDGVLLRVALFLLAGVVLAPLVAHAYARTWPKRSHS